jgi:hypothetical protein
MRRDKLEMRGKDGTLYVLSQRPPMIQIIPPGDSPREVEYRSLRQAEQAFFHLITQEA